MFQFSMSPDMFGPTPFSSSSHDPFRQPGAHRHPPAWSMPGQDARWEDDGHTPDLCSYTEGDGHRHLRLARGQSVEIELLPLIPGGPPPEYRLEWAGDTLRLHLDDGGSIRLDHVTGAGRLTLRVLGKLRLLQDAPIEGTATAAEVETSAA